MSKKTKLIIAVLLALGTLSWAGWQLFRPKPEEVYTSKEISIKQADVPDVATTTYEDWAGFKFDYPDILTVKEVELDRPEVYSSLEISGSDGQRLTVRVSDTATPSLIDWQKDFNRKHSVRKIDQTTLADLPAIRIYYGAPESKLTVALETNVLYQIEGPADSGFWNRAHDDLVGSWEFTSAAAPVTPATNPINSDETVTLIEESLE